MCQKYSNTFWYTDDICIYIIMGHIWHIWYCWYIHNCTHTHCGGWLVNRTGRTCSLGAGSKWCGPRMGILLCDWNLMFDKMPQDASRVFVGSKFWNLYSQNLSSQNFRAKFSSTLVGVLCTKFGDSRCWNPRWLVWCPLVCFPPGPRSRALPSTDGQSAKGSGRGCSESGIMLRLGAIRMFPKGRVTNYGGTELWLAGQVDS